LSGNLPPSIANLIRPPSPPDPLAAVAAQAGYSPSGLEFGGPLTGSEPTFANLPQGAAPAPEQTTGENPLEPPIKPVDPTKPTTYVGGQYYQGGNRVSGPSSADGQSAKPSGPAQAHANPPAQPPAVQQGGWPPPAQPQAQQGGQQGYQQGPNPIQAIVDLFSKGPGAFMQDLLGVSQQAYGNRIDPTTGRPLPGTSPSPHQGAPGTTPAEDEKQQAEQRKQDLGQGGTYILNDQGQRVRVQTNPDGSVKTDAQGNSIPAAQGTQAAPGAAVTRGSYPALNTRVTTNHAVSLGPVNQGLQDTLAAGAQQFENNNPGYRVQVNSGRRGGRDPHGRNNAVDLQIIGPNGAIANAGADTTGKYTELARSILGAQRALHPELNGRLAWGGYFNADGTHGFADPRTGANRPDLMHFDLEGNMPWRTAMRDRYYGLGATGNYGQGTTAQQGASREPPQPLPPGQSRPPADVGGALRTANGRPTQAMTDYIQERARAYNIDPNIALRVAKSEGFNQFSSGIRGENSWGAFQLNIQGGLGNDFQRETGLDPRDPKNEKQTIDWALKYASQHGWGPWHGAKNTGIGQWQGINRSAAKQQPTPPPAAPVSPPLQPYPGAPEGADWRASREQRPALSPTASAADFLRDLGFPLAG
jgi:hypothetical protein